MIPPYFHNENKSNAERKVFKIIENDLGNNWTCFHSLGLAQHNKKVEGEIDFVLVGESGIFCLEVKGGRVKRENGVWKFINRYGIESTKYESPFSQASTAMYSLMSTLQLRDKDFRKVLFGYGVVFPDIEFKIESPEWNGQIIYDRRDGKTEFSSYLMKLVKYWVEKNKYKKNLTPKQISKVIKYLRGDFELIQPLTNKLNEMEQKQIRLTENQYKALDRLRNNDRIFFQGTAGTGKTLLAIEKARRETLENSKVLYLCFNKLLGEKVKQKFNDENLDVEVSSVHKFFYSTIMKSSLKNEFLSEIRKFDQNETIVYKKVYTEFFINAIVESKQKFDYLIVDEGQDILNIEWMNALDQIIIGGLEDGKWAIFYDSNNQGEMYKNYDQMVVDYLKGYGAVEYMLDLNCRNTKPICIQTSLISGFRVEDTLINEGEKVTYNFYSDKSEQIKKVSSTINTLISKGINPNDITILLPNNRNISYVNKLNITCSLEKLTTKNINEPEKNTIYYTTVQSFKGLENQIVIYFGIDSIDGKWINTVNYVAMTRAKKVLFIFLDHSLVTKINKKSKDYLIREALQ
ncbi:nuclease-related domain-containing DEAD/DEAH box helicase [Virgibacillus siamensis]|uniref:nuclease-related domain-containing DEAD/DEAH box helicase n=1 Tax=Virgibacillus siamensis TaxID=480071 RepID=UPI001FEBA451|nr:NERD domain-containing protein/DEAD/DEAH box helicase [Virgibacillus siamensis]